MSVSDQAVCRFDSAAMLLPGRLRELVRTLTREQRGAAEEIRLRTGRALSVLLPQGETALGGEAVTVRDIAALVEIATGASVHTAGAMIRQGYIACAGGHRIGLCGSVYLNGGEVGGYSAYSSADLRIAREHRGVAEGIFPQLTRGGFASTLLVGTPGAGKTTLLRELTRLLATPARGWEGLRVSLVDERGELAAMFQGVPQLEVGTLTDVLDGCPKARGVMTVLRAMNPQVIALDEITDPQDVTAISVAANCGVALLATAHASGADELLRRPLYSRLLSQGIFENLVFVRQINGVRRYEVRRAGETVC